MEKIYLDIKEVLYPTGYNIQQNLSTINAVTDTLQKTANNTGRMVLCCMGSSGAIIAGIAASKMANVAIVHIKKEGEYSHNNNKDFEFVSDDYIVIIDDFISSGFTIRKIYSFLKEAKQKVNCITLAGGYPSMGIIEEINPDLFIYTDRL